MAALKMLADDDIDGDHAEGDQRGIKVKIASNCSFY